MFSFLAPVALRLFAGKALSSAKRGFAAIPPKVKLALLAIALLIAAYFVHQHHAHKALKAADAAGYARAKAEEAATIARVHQQAIALRDAANRLHASISQKSKEKNNAEIGRIDRAAADVLRGGPGKAGCGRLDYPELPAAAGGNEPGRGAAAAAVDPMSDPGRLSLIGLPFSAAVAAARQCDANRAEVLTWRQTDAEHRAAWPNTDGGNNVK